MEEATGASQCFVFQHMRRDSSMHNKECNGAAAKAHGAVARVHADYFPKMKADEALPFYTYDGSAEPPRFVFHSAIDVQADAERGGSVRPRRSIECRCLAVW